MIPSLPMSFVRLDVGRTVDWRWTVHDWSLSSRRVLRSYATATTIPSLRLSSNLSVFILLIFSSSFLYTFIRCSLSKCQRQPCSDWPWCWWWCHDDEAANGANDDDGNVGSGHRCIHCCYCCCFWCCCCLKRCECRNRSRRRWRWWHGSS